MMLDAYFKERTTLTRLRSGPTAAYMDSFAAALQTAGYSPWTVMGYMRAAWHLGTWMHQQKIAVAEITDETINAFAAHRSTCRCLRRNRGVYTDALTGVRHLVAHLRRTGVVRAADAARKMLPDVVAAFERWMIAHRGVRPVTLEGYRRSIVELVAKLKTPSAFNAKRLRRFVSDYIARHGRSCAKQVITATRMFLRYAITRGLCDAHLATAIPSIANWKQAALYPHLAASEVERLLTATVTLRERAILTLVARLGLRGGDVIALRLADIDWECATVRVNGKERRSTRLPLPQDVGDAILRYIGEARPRIDDDHVFLREYAPCGPLGRSSVTSMVARVAKRAGIKMPRNGAHILRHSLATRLVRDGVPLAAVKVLLRHSSEQTTAHYAKLDTPTLVKLAQPWPSPLINTRMSMQDHDGSLSRCVQSWPRGISSC